MKHLHLSCLALVSTLLVHGCVATKNPEQSDHLLAIKGRRIVDECAATKCSFLRLSQVGLADNADLAKLAHVRGIGLNYTNFNDLSLLSQMSWLERLSIGGSEVRDLSAIRALQNLKELDISSLTIDDYSALTALTKLEKLEIDHHQSGAIAAVKQLRHLRELKITNYTTGTKEVDLTPVANHPSLESIVLWELYPQSFAPLFTAPKLKEIRLIDAVGHGREAEVEKLIAKGIDVIDGVTENIPAIMP
ncbi:hypothetical protein SAMN04488030_0416 [Aliiroseovarius halocynthiae]|nr:leucine-rich repeat domain-containing protein [Aliiroseovarius halocynthiae]SMR70803.1 hypothetical protein SAMN04488030_0416 [Aliiroseovarius halocynthiae]